MTPQRKMDDIVLPQRKIEALRHIMRNKETPNAQTSFGNARKKPYRSFALWGVILAAFLFLFFSFSTLFEKATFTIIPKQKSAELSATFIALKTPTALNPMTFQVMTIEDTKTTTIPATEVREVERKAAGTIIIYNNFSKEPQRLIKNTRFENPEGLIFRIKESVTVPGMKGNVPGSIETSVYADEAGEKYNIGLSDFTIPGFKGTPRYSKFYARSATPMSGGFTGMVKTVSESGLARVRTELQNNLKNELLEKARKEKPDNFVLYEGGILLSFEDGPGKTELANTDTTTVEFSQKGVVRALLLDRSLLTEAILTRLVPERTSLEKIEIHNLDELSFNLNQKDQLAPLDLKSISFTLSGMPQFVWSTDIEKLKNSLVGKPKADVKTILSDFPSIARAEAVVRPFWKKTFPEAPKDIVIVSKLEK